MDKKNLSFKDELDAILKTKIDNRWQLYERCKNFLEARVLRPDEMLDYLKYVTQRLEL